MKKLLNICICLFATATVFSQTIQNSNLPVNTQNKNDSISVIISPGTNNSSAISHLESIVRSTVGANFKGYCTEHNVFFIMIDKNAYATSELFYSQLKSTSNITTLLLKEGIVSDILSFCESKIVKKTTNPDLEKALLDK